VVLPSGKAITYGYNSNGQVSSVTLDGSPSTTILNNLTYDPFGPITGWTWGNGTASTSRTFDTDGKLTQITSSGQRTFGYDDAFRITAVNDIATPANSWTLGYDILDRLNSATKTGTTIGYTYDANGNRLTQTGTSASTYTVSGTSNRVSSISGALVRTYGYNNSGSVTSSSATTHTYYNSGRMKTAKLGASSVTTYIYNALGERVKKSGGAIATAVYFAYDEAGHLVGEYNITGTGGNTLTAVQETVWLGGTPIATLRGTSVYYVHTDQLNTPRKVTNTSNQLRWSWDPNPFGDGPSTVLSENPSGLGTFTYNLRLPGQLFDKESNLNYNYFRDYDPAVGRYVESDPIGLAGGTSTYSYASNAPNLLSDASGLFALDITQSWRYVEDTPGTQHSWYLPKGAEYYNGQIPLGEVGAIVTGVRCVCHKDSCTGDWRLSGCFASLLIDAQIRNDLDGMVNHWVVGKEMEHVQDFLNGRQRFERMGDAIEKRFKATSFSSQSECESSPERAIANGLGLTRQVIWLKSRLRDSRGDHRPPVITPFR
jgi:RHS repeat-associated protein